MDTILDKSKFIRLVNDQHIGASLKTYSDTLLFYYIGHLAAKQNNGDFLEIGVGGSTHPFKELSELHNRTFNIVDINEDLLSNYSNLTHFPKAKIKTYCINSVELASILTTSGAGDLIYSHIDGSKNLDVTVSDLKYCLAAMSKNGIICQDDYGNHKWPTVTDAVQSMIYSGELKMLIVGDSSAWLTSPGYYDYWINLLTSDTEFLSLSKLLNIVPSSLMKKTPVYFFMNALRNSTNVVDLNDHEIDYFNNLLAFNKHYLKMPYPEQSEPGSKLRRRPGYLLTSIWSTIRGDSWPVDPPVTKQQIIELSPWIKDEIVKTHHLDLYFQHEVVWDNILKKS